MLTFDRLAPFPALGAIRSAAAAGDWPSVAARYGELDAWDLRTAGIRAVGETNRAEQWLEPLAADPANLLARAMLASRHIELGWAARTGYRAQHVSADQFKTFHEYLRRAELLLIDVTARDPEHVAAWTLRLMTVRGLELGQSEALRRWDQLAKVAPHHLAGQAQIIQQLCPKWSGSFEKLHAFASERAEAAPDGSLNPVIVVDAHLEHWGELPEEEKLGYLRSPEVHRSVLAAAAKSVLHPDFRPAYNWVAAHCVFAMYHSIIGDGPAAAVHFRAMGRYAVEQPWEWFYGDPLTMFHEHRRAALGKGS